MAINKKRRVPKRIAQTILNSLKGGVVPRIGLPYITVGRKAEIEALLHDVELIENGGASFRFIVGRYGSGKSFLLQTIRNYVMDKNFVVVDGDLSPERRLQGGKGQGLATYRELIQNLSTKTRPEGGALTLILDRWINSVQMQVATDTNLNADDPAFEEAVNKKKNGYNCAQAVACTYCDYAGIDEETMFNICQAFGTGMGTLEGTCGAIVGAGVVLGMMNKQRLKTNQDIRKIMQDGCYKGVEVIMISLNLRKIIKNPIICD